jgi:hypothetical protein
LAGWTTLHPVVKQAATTARAASQRPASAVRRIDNFKIPPPPDRRIVFAMQK